MTPMTTPTPTPSRSRPGALALAAAALLFAAFPLVRPFFDLDVFSPALAAVASGPLTSAAWAVAHLMLVAAFVLLPVGLLGVGAALADTPSGPRARRGTMLAVAGIGLVTPAAGVEVFAMPILARLHLDGVPGVTGALAGIYRGPMTLVMLAGLLLLALGAADLARAAWSSGLQPRWPGAVLAIGLGAWLPLLPPPVRILDGLVIGLGGLGLAWAVWRQEGHPAAEEPAPSAAGRVERVRR
jgi:hypothetical protein